MPSTELDTLADLVTEVLAGGPRTGHQIARALTDRHGLDLQGREGSLYAIFLSLEREGWIEASWKQRRDGSRRRYYELPVLHDTGDLGNTNDLGDSGDLGDLGEGEGSS